jgi:integrase
VSKSTRPRRNRKSSKPAKPYPDFPLFPHATRRWAKKIRGRMHYFGPWDDPDAALKKYLEQKDDLHAGRTPRVQGDGLTVRDLVNRYLTAKRRQFESGELAPITFSNYYATCADLVAAFGRSRLVSDLAADDFERLRAALAKRLGPAALGMAVLRTRMVFKYGFDAGLLDRPVRYGPGFVRPSRKTMRLARQAKGPRVIEAADLRKMIAAADVQLRAVLMLGINAGLGNADAGRLRPANLDLERGWLDYPRPKTGVPRRCPLWPETVAALREAMASRPAPLDPADAGLALLTPKGKPWAKSRMVEAADEGGPGLAFKIHDRVTLETRKLLQSLGLHRVGLNFYALRHMFETVAGETKDQPAVDAIMGHVAQSDDMGAVYRERISDDRLKAVTDYVRAWLFPPKKETAK